MKIIKFTKKNKSEYKLLLENNKEIILNEELILKFDLLLTREIDNLPILLKENEYYAAYSRSIKYITRRIRTKKEIEYYLKDYESKIVNQVISNLTKENIINDKIYISSYVHDSINLKLVGKNKIISELLLLGLNEKDIYEEVNKIDNQVFIEKINKYINKYIKKDLPKNKFIIKITNDLIYKGFNKADILLCLENIEYQESDINIKKDYDKLYKKYKDKYDSYKLKQVIYNKLNTKGYDSSQIKEVLND